MILTQPLNLIVSLHHPNSNPYTLTLGIAFQPFVICFPQHRARAPGQTGVRIQPQLACGQGAWTLPPSRPGYSRHELALAQWTLPYLDAAAAASFIM